MREINEGSVKLPKDKWYVRLLRWLRMLPQKKWYGYGTASENGIQLAVYDEDDSNVDHTGLVSPNTDKTCGYGIPCDKPIYERYKCCGKHGYVIGSGGVYQSDYVPPQVPGD